MLSRFERFSYSIAGIYRCLQNIERAEMEKLGYKGSFAIYLATLYRHPEGLTCAQLSEICIKDKAAVSRIVTQMEQLSLITRNSQTDNSYRARLTLTQNGKQAAEYVCKKAQTAIANVSNLGEDERQLMYASLEKIYQGLSKLCESGIPEKE